MCVCAVDRLASIMGQDNDEGFKFSITEQCPVFCKKYNLLQDSIRQTGIMDELLAGATNELSLGLYSADVHFTSFYRNAEQGQGSNPENSCSSSRSL